MIAAIFLVYEIIGICIGPLLENSFALSQMQTSAESSMLIQGYCYIKNYSFVFGVLLVIFVFRKDLSRLYTKLKEKKEKINEQN